MTQRFEVFGGVRVFVDQPRQLSPQVTRLLGILLADAGKPVSTDQIVDRLWEGTPPASAPKIVHIGIAKLRRALEPVDAKTPDDSSGVLHTVAGGYVLDAVAADLDEWRHAATRAEREGATNAKAALDAATDACARWRGRPWGSQADEGWLQASVRALEARQREIEELRNDLRLRLGLSSSAIVDFEQAAESEPLRERRWAQLMLALYRAGRQSDALRTYQRARDVLQRELGLEPGPELRRLELSILQQDGDLERSAPRPDDVSSPTSFVGRTDELAHLARALDRERLVTVVGIGGIGKTRLVQEFVHRHWSPEPVQSVSIAGVEHLARLDAHLATQLGVFLDPGDTLVGVLAAMDNRAGSLLVIHGAEAFPEAIGALALALLERCRGLRMVVTSRVPLGVGVERIVRVASLPQVAADAPLSGSDLALMIDRAGYDSAALDESSITQLRAACASAAGVPLLVELAARAFQLGAPSPSFSRTENAVAASIEHSLAAVDDAAERLLRQGSVLPGGLSERVAATIADLDVVAAQRALRQLAWLHLVDAAPARSSLRYRSLDPIRSTLQSEMDTASKAAARERAAGAIQEVVDRLWPDQLQPVNLAAMDDVDEEHDNLRFVLDDRLAVDPDRALDLAIAASEYWSIRGHIPEAQQWITAAVAAARPVGPRRWAAELAYARSTRTIAEVARRRDPLERACEEARHDAEHSVVFGGLLMFTAIARGWSGDRAGAARALAEASALDA
ncbi:MAG: BTAD domain-containing putative transcriptional regulator, partial [Acidimicrobiia bacterium]